MLSCLNDIPRVAKAKKVAMMANDCSVESNTKNTQMSSQKDCFCICIIISAMCHVVWCSDQMQF